MEPFALNTPVALAGPGVSRPTTATSSSSTPAVRDRDGQAILDLLQADVGAFNRPRRMLAEPLDEKPALEIEQRVVDGGAAEVNACDDRHPAVLAS